MAIIDDTYFIGDINLPTDNANYQNKLTRFIETTEREYLQRILGYELWKAFNAELPTPTTQRFVNIWSGAEFTNLSTGNPDNWNGLQNTELESFLAYFAYVEYVGRSQLSESGQGTTSNLFENAERLSPISNQSVAYNRGVCLYNKLYDFLEANESTYPEWVDSGKINDYGNELNI
jgi:hypothetical protein